MKIDTYLDIAYGIGLIFTIVVASLHLFLRERQPPNPRLKNRIQKMVNGYFKDIASFKKKYKGNWIFVEEWKGQMRGKANAIIDLYQKEGQTKKVWNAARNLDMDFLEGLDLIQNGNNPLTITEGKGRETVPLSLLGKIVVPLLVIIPAIFLYLVLSGISWGILGLTFTFGWFLFPNWLPPSQYDLEKFNFKHLLGILFVSGIGYFLNQWTYAQSGEIQLAVTIGLPILYGIIYYKLHHKKSIREI